MLTALLLMVTVCGDLIVFKSKYSESQIYRAYTDSLTHASIGCISAIIFFTYDINIRRPTSIYNVIICTVLSSFIDVDHFFMARSFNIKDFVNLKRGIFHCTSFGLLISAILYLISYYMKNQEILLWNFMLIIAYSSHHVRDANRRGLWFYPYGHTRPLSYYFYVFLICALPHTFAYLYMYLKLNFKSYTNDYTIV